MSYKLMADPFPVKEEEEEKNAVHNCCVPSNGPPVCVSHCFCCHLMAPICCPSFCVPVMVCGEVVIGLALLFIC